MEKKVEQKHCAFYLPKKVRFCKFERMPNSQYCTFHIGLENSTDYIKCPADPRHFIKKVDLEGHIKICSKTKQEKEIKQSVWYKENVNVANKIEDIIKLGFKPEGITTKAKLKELPLKELRDLCEHIKEIYKKAIGIAAAKKISLPEEDFWEYLPGLGVAGISKGGHDKHEGQHMLLGNELKEAGLLCEKYTYIEYGAGKGRLAHEISEKTENKSNILLLERESRKLKFDAHHRKDAFKRIRADIMHFDLEKLPLLFPSKTPTPEFSVVAIAKHLCGGATDLCLYSLTRPEMKTALSKGTVVAPCCHHSCDIKTYVNLKYLLELGLSHDEIPKLFAITMWANSGEISKKKKYEAEEIGITTKERTCTGFLAKRIINIGRLVYMQDKGYDVYLKKYCGLEYSPENLIILCRKKPELSH